MNVSRRGIRTLTKNKQHLKPDFKLQCLQNCCIDLHRWDDEAAPEKQQHATLHRGQCLKCHTSVRNMKHNAILKDVAVFSARKNWDPLFGLGDGAAYREWLYLSEHATVVESMLVALCHMQVSVCYLRSARRVGYGVPGFHSAGSRRTARTASLATNGSCKEFDGSDVASAVQKNMWKIFAYAATLCSEF
jgi:hypothetical protein